MESGDVNTPALAPVGKDAVPRRIRGRAGLTEMAKLTWKQARKLALKILRDAERGRKSARRAKGKR